MNELRLVVVHYHLLPGGVTSVIRDGLAALALYGGWDRVVATILAGRSSGVASFLEQTSSIWDGGLAINVQTWPVLDYRSDPWPSQLEFEAEAIRLAQQLTAACNAIDADVLWVHNPTLGKNPLVTEAVSQLPQRAPGLRILFHIHDFAECGRLDNLRTLRQCCGRGGVRTPFPAAPGLSVITLTTADRNRLTRAGYPESNVFSVPDPVPMPRSVRPFSPHERAGVARRIAAWGRGHAYRFEPGGKWLVAPLRTIRRKNVLELALLLRLLGDGWRLLITLDCNSDPERPYAEMVKECLRREDLPAVLGFGPDLIGEAISFDPLLASADAIGTTSVLEGFGLTFVEAGLRRRPLLGRDLRDVSGDLAGLPRQGLYGALCVPLEERDRVKTLNMYREKVTRTAEELEITPAHRDRAMDRMESTFENNLIDFSLLDLASQARAVHRLADPAARDEVLSANPDVVAALEGIEAPPSELDQELLANCVGPERFAHRFREVLQSPPGVSRDTSEVSQHLVEQFFHPPYLRLLFDAGDDWRLWERELPRAAARRSPPPHPTPTVTVNTTRERFAGIRVVLWDVYGTLLRQTSRGPDPQSFLDCLAAAGLDITGPQGNAAEVFHSIIREVHVAARVRGLRQPEVLIEQIWQQLAERILPGQWMTRDQARYAAARYELTVHPTQPMPGSSESIIGLHQLGIGQGIISNSQFYTPPILREALGRETWALLDPDLLFWSYEYGVAKPDPAFFTRARTVLTGRGVQPHQVLMVGDDRENDAAPACAIGWRTLLFIDEEDSEAARQEDETEAVHAEPDAVCHSLAALPSWLGTIARGSAGSSDRGASMIEAPQPEDLQPPSRAN